jgi:isoleucyl-tRNA synthetase
MKFKQKTRRLPNDYEKDLIIYWKTNKLFEKSVEQRPKENSYVFYDGPPFITGVPHQGTLLSSIVKDTVPRYWTMKGKRVERIWGWDCHGLPAEVYTEQKLGIKDKRDIGTKISLEEYITACRDNMIQTGNEWEVTIDRIGRWVDFQGAYKTMDKDYMESVWWAFKEIYDRGKIYEGEKVLMYCIRDATPISKAEVAMDNSYKDITDPSVYAKFKLKDSESYLLVWTTVPWTLLANTGLAVDKSAVYSEVSTSDGNFIIAKKLLKSVLINEKNQQIEYTLIRDFKGEELVGKAYEPIFKDYGPKAHKIHNADFVTLDEGTGIVSQAPAYGEEDYILAKSKDFPVVSVIDDSGFLIDSPWKGQQVWDVDKDIAKTFLEEGKVWRIHYYRHSYPHCHRCGTKLIYRAHPSWFLNIDDQRQAMLDNNSDINWFPEHIKNRRFTNTIESAPDWNISRDRFWATAMPVWKGKDKDGNEKVIVVGSYQELEDLSSIRLEDYHRPWIDAIEFEIDGIKYKHIGKVLDCWFESGSMPFAMYHYPFENVDKFESNFPGDFVAEYIGQVRAWFYYLHSVSVALFDNRAFNNVIVTGTISGNDGRKMSKSYGNYTDPNELMDQYSADSLRFLFLSSPLLNGEDFSLQDKDVSDVYRKLSMIWNMYDFFTLYADVDDWDSGLKPGELPEDPIDNLTNILDKWIVSRVHQLGQSIDENMQKYDIPNATKPIFKFLDDASNWYIRRSRKRFWKTDNDEDKNNAYKTLHYVLTQLSIITAPFIPFLAEEIYQNLIGGESVHLLDWPNPGYVNNIVIDSMDWAREVINEGLSQRASIGLKLRQPLSKVVIKTNRKKDDDILSIIQEELNVKSIDYHVTNDKTLVKLDTKITDDLRLEGVAREIIRNVQQARKDAGLEVNDRISLGLNSDSKLITTSFKNENLLHEIIKETLAISLNSRKEYSYVTIVKIEGQDLEIKISKENKNNP